MREELAGLIDLALELTADQPKLQEHALRAQGLFRRRCFLEAARELRKVQRKFPYQLYRLGHLEHGLGVEAHWK